MRLLSVKNGFVINFFVLLTVIGTLLCVTGCGGGKSPGGGGSSGDDSRVWAPVASVPSGGIVNGISVSLSTKTSGADIYYTMDGTEPSRESNLYTEPFEVDENLLIRAFAVKSGLEDSKAVTYTYTVGDIPGLIGTLDNGSHITVPQGVYELNIDFSGKDLILRSADPDDAQVVAATIIDGGGSGPVVTFNNGESTGAILEGFTIRNGGGKQGGSYTYGGGIYIENASPVIRKNVITMNNADVGGGIYLKGNCAPQIKNNHLVQNQALGTLPGYGGGGIMVHNNKQPAAVIENNRISDNSVNGFGGGLQIRDSAVIVRGNEICENNAAGSGGGIHGRIAAVDCNAPQIENNRIKRNETGSLSNGGGLSLTNYVENLDFTVKGNEFSENTAAFGGGVSVSEYLIKFENNSFSQNTATTRGGGLYVDGGSQATIKNNTFGGNTPDHTYAESSGTLVDEGGNIYN